MLSKHDIGQNLYLSELQGYIKPGSRVTVIPLSFRDEEIPNEQEWDRFYGANGFLSKAIEESFNPYGVKSGSIEYIDYFRDNPSSAKQKSANADIICFPGGTKARRGEPDKIMERAIELELFNYIENHRGVVIGAGAGAQVQLANYHIIKKGKRMSPTVGFRFASGFDVMPNYTGEESQNYFIKRVVSETGTPVYAIGEKGALIVENGEMRIIGDVQCFRKKED
jgi:hypothetical protein